MNLSSKKILAFAGSLRKDSYNQKLLSIAVRGAQEKGAEVTVIHLRDYQLPLYNQEIEDEQGLPKEALALKTLFMDHEGLLLACPEYNSSMTAVFKNTIDWVSRKATRDEDDLSCFVGKVVTLMSASPGPLGGLRGLVHVRSLFSCLYSLVLPRQKSIPFADRAFDGEGNLLKTQDQADTLRLGRELAEFLMR